ATGAGSATRRPTSPAPARCSPPVSDSVGDQAGAGPVLFALAAHDVRAGCAAGRPVLGVEQVGGGGGLEGGDGKPFAVPDLPRPPACARLGDEGGGVAARPRSAER